MFLLYSAKVPFDLLQYSHKVPVMVYVYAVVLTLINLLCWVSILFGLPGTWLWSCSRC
jgi:hypothetical protein